MVVLVVFVCMYLLEEEAVRGGPEGGDGGEEEGL